MEETNRKAGTRLDRPGEGRWGGDEGPGALQGVGGPILRLPVTYNPEPRLCSQGTGGTVQRQRATVLW